MFFGFRRARRDSQSVLKVLQELRESLLAALGTDLQALIAHGDYVRPPRFDPRHSQVNLMLVLRKTGCDTLDRLVVPLRNAERRIPLETMTLTRNDLLTSCDVFPVKFRDIQLHHRLLCGEDVLSDLKFTDGHLRLRCEQELKNLMIRLRWVYLHRSGDADQLAPALLETAGQILPILEACLSLKSGMEPEDDADVARMFAGEFGLNADALVESLQLRDGEPRPAPGLKQLFDRFMELVQNAAHTVDQMEITP